MDSNVAKSLVGFYNCLWLSESLLMKRGDQNSGIDLLDENNRIGIELKSKDRFYHPRNFALENRQVRKYPQENKETDLYWALMLYSSEKRPKQIRNSDDMSDLIYNREIWFLPWEWARRFRVHTCQTADYRYASLRSLPGDGYFRDQRVNGGLFHVPKETAIDKRVRSLGNKKKRQEFKELMVVPF